MINLHHPQAAGQMVAAFDRVISDQVAVINQTANNVAARAWHLSPAASPAKIEQNLLRPVRVQRPGRAPYTIPLANILARRPGQSPEENQAAAKRLVARKKAAAGWSRSGWAHAVKMLNPHSPRKNLIPPGALRVPPTGYATPARAGETLTATIENRVILKGPRARAAEARRHAAFARALREEEGIWQRKAEAQANLSIARILR